LSCKLDASSTCSSVASGAMLHQVMQAEPAKRYYQAFQQQKSHLYSMV
jgi:hypothetical protein